MDALCRLSEGGKSLSLQVLDVVADRQHLAARLVAGDEGMVGERRLAVQDVDVGAADATGIDLD
jgi:hypothetical protein